MAPWPIVAAAAIYLVGWLPQLPGLTALPALLAVAMTVLAWRRVRRSLLALLLGAVFGIGWGYSLLDGRLPEALEGITLAASFAVLEPPQYRSYSSNGGRPGASGRARFAARVRLLECPPALPACEREVGRVLLSYYGDQTLRAGDTWLGQVRLKRPRGLANPGSFNYEAWLARHRFVATGYLRDAGLGLIATGGAGPVQAWRQVLTGRIRSQALDDPVRGVLLALTTGDRSGMDHQLWQRLQRYGLNHLMVISGLHVGLVAGIGFLLGRPFSPRAAHLGAAGLALVYSAAAGFALPTVRALAMLASVQLAALAGRRLQPWRSFGLALLLVALIDPLASHSAGFWLSFAAVAFIFYLHAMYPDWPAWRLTLAIQCCLSLLMGLVASFWFGGWGWVAPLANLVAVPVLTFWLAPLCLLGALLAPLWTAAAEACWALAAFPITGFLELDRLLGESALALWINYRPRWPALLGIVAGSLLLLARRGWPQRGLAVLLFTAALTATRPGVPSGGLDLWLLDVGQGLALVVVTENFQMVYDTGAGDPAGPNMATNVIVPFLEQLGVDGLDLLVLSHGDRDHASGVYSLHHRFAIAETWYGEALFPGIESQRRCRAGHAYRRGELILEVLSPMGRGGEGNDSSCVLRLSVPGLRLLLPGDITAEVEHELMRRSREQLAADVLVAPHHGSRSSSSSAFIAAVGPALALVSRGYGNRFGHPHPEISARYRRFGLDLCDTAHQGAVQIRVREGAIEPVTGWRSQKRYYWSGAASPACEPAYNGAFEHLR